MRQALVTFAACAFLAIFTLANMSIAYAAPHESGNGNKNGHDNGKGRRQGHV